MDAAARQAMSDTLWAEVRAPEWQPSRPRGTEATATDIRTAIKKHLNGEKLSMAEFAAKIESNEPALCRFMGLRGPAKGKDSSEFMAAARYLHVAARLAHAQAKAENAERRKAKRKLNRSENKKTATKDGGEDGGTGSRAQHKTGEKKAAPAKKNKHSPTKTQKTSPAAASRKRAKAGAPASDDEVNGSDEDAPPADKQTKTEASVAQTGGQQEGAAE